MVETSGEPRKPTLQELLVPMWLPGDDTEKTKRTKGKDFSPDIRAELDRKLAQSARMVIDLRR